MTYDFIRFNMACVDVTRPEYFSAENVQFNDIPNNITAINAFKNLLSPRKLLT